MTTPDWSAIQAENPNLTFDSVALLGEGWGAWAYRINTAMVIKLSKRTEGWDQMAKEFAILEFVQPHLPLAVPKPLMLNQNSVGWPFGYTIYSLMSGQPIDLASMSKGQKSAAAETLANFLRSLHALKPDDALRSLLPNEDPKIELGQIYEQSDTQVLPSLSPQDASLLRSTMRDYLEDEENFSFRPTLIHADLHNDHLLAQDNVISGVLDFDGAIISDPDMDFSDLTLEFGADFAAECARFYGHTDPKRLVEKLRRRSIFVYLYDILYAPEYGLTDDVEWAWAALREWLQVANSNPS